MKLRCMDKEPNFVCVFISLYTFQPFLPLGRYEEWYYKHLYGSFCLNSCFQFFCYLPISRVTGLYHVLALSLLWPNTWQKQPKGGKIYLAQGFRGFCPCHLAPCAWAENHSSQVVWQRRISAHGGWEVKRK
jgi:hypothetical protein